MKMNKNNKINLILAMMVFIVSLVLAICNGVMEELKFGIPVVNFFFYLFTGFALISYGIAIKNKKPQYFFLGAILATLCVIYLFILLKIVWWIILLSCIVVIALSILLSYLIAGNQTEDIALNKSPEYKNYKERQAEKEEKERKEKERKDV